jgi:monothiol glutaredoxin
MPLDETTREKITSLIEVNDVVLFMKGNRETPRCGFSATVVRILDTLLPAYETFDVLSDPNVREGIKEYSAWPTIPQLYIKGEFVGGCDAIEELQISGELAAKLGVELGDGTAPAISISDAAADALRRAVADAPPGHALHLAIDARYRSSLFVAPVWDGAVEATANGISLRMDRPTALRAEEAHLDVAEIPDGPGFQVHLPHAPHLVQPLSVHELKRRLESGEPFEFVDVRPPEERARAEIPGATPLGEDVARRLEALPKDTALVFHSHRGRRSHAAAEHFTALGFTDVYTVVGGIDAWSLEIDPEVPRYQPGNKRSERKR